MTFNVVAKILNNTVVGHKNATRIFQDGISLFKA